MASPLRESLSRGTEPPIRTAGIDPSTRQPANQDHWSVGRLRKEVREGRDASTNASIDAETLVRTIRRLKRDLHAFALKQDADSEQLPSVAQLRSELTELYNVIVGAEGGRYPRAGVEPPEP